MLALGSLILAVVVSIAVLQLTGIVDFIDLAITQCKSLPALAPYVATYQLGRKNSIELEAKRQELLRWEEELTAREKKLEESRQQLEAMQADLEEQRTANEAKASELKQWEQELARQKEKLESIDKLRKIYAEMEPQNAAAILAQLDRTTVVRILGGMDPERAAEHMAAMDPKLAAEISSMMTSQ